MLLSLALIFIAGLAMASLTEKIGLPRIVGMILTGILIGPYVLNFLDPSILEISAQLRKIALVIILIKAGLSLSLDDLKKVGRPAVLMSFVPATAELLAYVLFAPKLLGVTIQEAALMGAVLAAVSPAVVVPRMVKLMDEGYGTDKGIPQLILAGASCDDVYTIVMFYAFLSIVSGGHASVMDFVKVPVSILLGIGIGAVCGYLLSRFFAYIDRKKPMDLTQKVIIVLALSCGLTAAEDLLKEYISMSGLLAVMSMCLVTAMKSSPDVTEGLKGSFGKLWTAFECLLFVLVGASVDIRFAAGAGVSAIIMIFAALAVRTVGVWLCLLGTDLNRNERIFCVIAYLPKATVQAAIGGVALAAGLSCGNIVLSVAVIGILITAPLGALGIDRTYRKLLQKHEA